MDAADSAEAPLSSSQHQDPTKETEQAVLPVVRALDVENILVQPPVTDFRRSILSSMSPLHSTGGLVETFPRNRVVPALLASMPLLPSIDRQTFTAEFSLPARPPSGPHETRFSSRFFLMYGLHLPFPPGSQVIARQFEFDRVYRADDGQDVLFGDAAPYVTYVSDTPYVTNEPVALPSAEMAELRDG